MVTATKTGQGHYVATAGLRGYLANYSSSHDSLDEAVGALVQLHDLGQRRASELKRSWWLDLNIQRDGNEYLQIFQCDCQYPSCHEDG